MIDKIQISDLETRLRRIVGIVKRDERLLGLDADKCVRGRAAIAAGRRMLDRLREEAAARAVSRANGVADADPEADLPMTQISVENRQVVSREGVARHGEVMTARREVDAMLDLVADEAARLDSRFLEPACGDGNFLVAILERKLRSVDANTIGGCERQMLVALSSIYGIDIQFDNVERSRQRLLAAIDMDYARRINCWTKKAFMLDAQKVVEANIKWGDALSMTSPPGGDPIQWTEWTWPITEIVRSMPPLDQPKRIRFGCDAAGTCDLVVAPNEDGSWSQASSAHLGIHGYDDPALDAGPTYATENAAWEAAIRTLHGWLHGLKKTKGQTLDYAKGWIDSIAREKGISL